jgi:hypothetical protein
MQKGTAFVLVGHKNWGKSRTLKALADGSSHLHTLTVKSHNFFIRRMSNDDVPEKLPNRFTDFVENLDADSCPYLIITLCPDFTNSLPKTKAVLKELVKKYRLFFFVLRFKYGCDKEISDAEIEGLKQFGEVKVFPTKGADDKVRAKVFRTFIESRL